MPFDPLVANAGRLRILTALAVEERQEFVSLRRRTQLTDGNLAAHARRLHSAGLIDIDKQFRAGKPVTSYLLTADGRRALEAHARRLVAALSSRRLPATPAPIADKSLNNQNKPAPAAPADTTRPRPIPVPAVPETLADSDDDWVD
jgi:DNA-binding MarR family transcriptional regulator